MVKINHLIPATLYNVTTMKQEYYNEYFEIGQQKLNYKLLEIGLPADDPVYTLIEILEELNYSSLLARSNSKGRKGYNPIMMFAVLLYANIRGIRAIDKIVELCCRDIAFIKLTKGERPQRDAFYQFLNNKLTTEILEDLHYQFIRVLQKKGYVTLKELFIDGTKIEANANRYTFVWRGSINYQLAVLLDTIDNLYNKYNIFINNKNYNLKYELADAIMFSINGMDKVRKTIQENRERKKNKKKKKSNNTIIEIDNASPIKLLKLQTDLVKIANGEGITFTISKGQRKTELQKLYEELESCSKRLLKYKEHFRIMGSDRNSYSKTDLEATFMRMKDDHMKNGQLKPAYNVQIAVENYIIIHSYISNDRADYNTLIPVLEKHNQHFGHYPDDVTADSGYSSEKNLLFLNEHKIQSYIKLQEHEQMKTKAYQQDISKHYNMKRIENAEGSYYLCHNNRKLVHQQSEKHQADGYVKTFEIYACYCDGCPLKAQCLYKYDEEKHINKNKVIKVNEQWEALKISSHANIQSDKGILNRQIRSIQTEGHFGDIKENENFRRFNHRSSDKVYKEFLLYALGRNINKYHRFEHGKIKKYEGKIEENVA